MVDLLPVKIMLGISTDDETQDSLLSILKQNAQTMIKLELRATTFPDDLDFVADELTIKRYNKMTSEGMVNETSANRNITFQQDDLKEYRQILENWLAMNPDEGNGNKLVML